MEYEFKSKTTVKIVDIFAYSREVEKEIRAKITKDEIELLLSGYAIRKILFDNVCFIIEHFGMEIEVENLNTYIELDLTVDIEE